MKIPLVDLKVQYQAISEEINQAIQSCLDENAFIGGKILQAFNEKFADYIGAKYAIGVGNGTDALFIALKSFGIGKGDEVITAANSFIATSEAITATGAKVVFVDCNTDYYTIDSTKIEEKINAKTRAIVPVHLYGQPADMDPICSIAKKFGLKIICDAAQAHGAMYKCNKIGSIGDAVIFSFYPGKNLGAYGDAGMIVTDDEKTANFCRIFANHGRLSKFNHELEGVNSRMDTIQAAILSVKLNYLAQWTKERRKIAYRYNELLNDTDLILPKELTDTKCVYHLYVIRSQQRDKLKKILGQNGISAGIHYPIGLPFLKAYEYLSHKPEDFPVTYDLQNKILSLPIYPELNENKIMYIVDKIKEFNNVSR